MYSRTWGYSSLPTVMATSGIISRTIRAARCSCFWLRTDHTKEMATASTPSLRKSSHALRTSFSFIGVLIEPSDDHPFTDALSEVARHQHDRGWIFGIVAVAILLVAQPDLDRILMACRADQPSFASLVLNECIETDRGAVNAQVAFRDDRRGAFAEIVSDLLQTFPDGQGRIGRRRKHLEQADVAGLIGQHEVGEGAASIDSEAILGSAWRRPLSCWIPFESAGRSHCLVARILSRRHIHLAGCRRL